MCDDRKKNQLGADQDGPEEFHKKPDSRAFRQSSSTMSYKRLYPHYCSVEIITFLLLQYDFKN